MDHTFVPNNSARSPIITVSVQQGRAQAYTESDSSWVRDIVSRINRGECSLDEARSMLAEEGYEEGLDG